MPVRMCYTRRCERSLHMPIPKEDHTIVAVHITDRLKEAVEVQKLLTRYGGQIKTRLGLHEIGTPVPTPAPPTACCCWRWSARPRASRSCRTSATASAAWRPSRWCLGIRHRRRPRFPICDFRFSISRRRRDARRRPQRPRIENRKLKIENGPQRRRPRLGWPSGAGSSSLYPGAIGRSVPASESVLCAGRATRHGVVKAIGRGACRVVGVVSCHGRTGLRAALRRNLHGSHAAA